MPLLDVERPQLAQHLGAEMWRDLMLQKLPLALCRARGDAGGGLPLVDARAHEIDHRGLARFDVVAFASSGDQLGTFDLCLALRAGEAMPFAPALPGLRIAHVDDDGPMTGRALADVALHFEPSFGFVARLSSEPSFGSFGSVTRLSRKRSRSSGGRYFASFSSELSGKASNVCNMRLIVAMISAC